MGRKPEGRELLHHPLGLPLIPISGHLDLKTAATGRRSRLGLRRRLFLRCRRVLRPGRSGRPFRKQGLSLTAFPSRTSRGRRLTRCNLGRRNRRFFSGRARRRGNLLLPPQCVVESQIEILFLDIPCILLHCLRRRGNQTVADQPHHPEGVLFRIGFHMLAHDDADQEAGKEQEGHPYDKKAQPQLA